MYVWFIALFFSTHKQVITHLFCQEINLAKIKSVLPTMVIAKWYSHLLFDPKCFSFLFFLFLPCPIEEEKSESGWVGVWLPAGTNPSQLSLLFCKKRSEKKRKKKMTVFSHILSCRMHGIACAWLLFNFNKTFLVVSKFFGKCSWVQGWTLEARDLKSCVRRFLNYVLLPGSFQVRAKPKMLVLFKQSRNLHSSAISDWSHPHPISNKTGNLLLCQCRSFGPLGSKPHK